MNKTRDKTNKQFDHEKLYGILNVPKDFYDALSRRYREDKNANIGEIIKTKDKHLKFCMSGSNGKAYDLNLEKMHTPYVIFSNNLENEKITLMNKPNVKGNLTLTEFKEAKKVEVRETRILEKEIRLDRLPRARINLKDTETLSKRPKLEPNDLKKELFELFEDVDEMTLDDINNDVEQPRQYLTNILDEICHKRKEKNKYVYFLKAEFKLHDETDAKKKLKVK